MKYCYFLLFCLTLLSCEKDVIDREGDWPFERLEEDFVSIFLDSGMNGSDAVSSVTEEKGFKVREYLIPVTGEKADLHLAAEEWKDLLKNREIDFSAHHSDDQVYIRFLDGNDVTVYVGNFSKNMRILISVREP